MYFCLRKFLDLLRHDKFVGDEYMVSVVPCNAIIVLINTFKCIVSFFTFFCNVYRLILCTCVKSNQNKSKLKRLTYVKKLTRELPHVTNS